MHSLGMRCGNCDLLQANDGGVVYLNGNELFRWNVPTGSLSYDTLATAAGEKVKWMEVWRGPGTP
jgi:hypothetical protein